MFTSLLWTLLSPYSILSPTPPLAIKSISQSDISQFAWSKINKKLINHNLKSFHRSYLLKVRRKTYCFLSPNSPLFQCLMNTSSLCLLVYQVRKWEMLVQYLHINLIHWSFCCFLIIIGANVHTVKLCLCCWFGCTSHFNSIHACCVYTCSVIYFNCHWINSLEWEVLACLLRSVYIVCVSGFGKR